MANKYRYRFGPLNVRWMEKSGTVAVVQGDMMKIATNGTGMITPCTAATDWSGLVGVALGASPATDTTGTRVRIAIAEPTTVFEFAAASSTYFVGDTFAISSSQLLVEKTITDLTASASTVVAVCARTNNMAGTKVLVSFLGNKFQRILVGV